MQTEQTETHLGKQVLIGLIDAGLILILFWQYTKYMAELSNFGIAIYPVHPIFIIAIAFIFYRFICLLLMNGTIGMKIFRVVYLNADEEPLSFYDKLLAACFILYRGVDYYDKKDNPA